MSTAYRPDYRYPTNGEKKALLELARAGKAPRVLCRWSANPRIVVLDPQLNPEGYTYHGMLHDPTVAPIVQSRYQEYWNTTMARTCDMVEQLPEVWDVSVEYHNVYDAAYFGAPVHYPEHQVPTAHPHLTLDDVDEFLRQDYSRPLENPYVKDMLAFREQLIAATKDFRHLGRPARVLPFTLNFDGPLTAAYMIFGEDMFVLLAAEPDKAARVLLHITDAVILRNQALLQLSGQPTVQRWGSLADDAVQLISTRMYEDLVLPAHERWYSTMSTTTPATRGRFMHCCGDGTRHFPIMSTKLGVSSFDTGFPVDHGQLRRDLGSDVYISGGPAIGMFITGTPEQLYAETRRILESGVKEGGRFGLREGNNLPPRVPLENLLAVYQACLEHGAV